MKTTLFMLVSVDGKISTGSDDERDFDKDLPNITGVAEGLNQYYDLEQQTDLYSFNTGRVMAKVGWNEPKDDIKKIPVSFVIVDNKPHLTEVGVKNLLRHCRGLTIVSTNSAHPALGVKDSKLDVIQFEEQINFGNLFEALEKRGIKQMTIQSGSDMNATLLRAGLISEVSIVVAPMLVGGKSAPSLIGGDSLRTVEDLHKIKTMELIEVNKLDHSYLHLRYKVL